jgi:replicative DNA helicase
VASKYVDVTAIMQVIGCVYNNPQILEFEDKYTITDEDFPDEFHRTVFGAIYKIYELGAKTITLENLADFLSSRPKSAAIYKKNDGDKWLLKVADVASQLSFDFYYNRLKKMTLLRAYDNYGVDVSDIYDPDNILDIKKKQLQEDLLDNSSLEEIADRVDRKISDIRLKYVDDTTGEAIQAGKGVLQLIQKFKDHPEVGVPLYGRLVNTVTRGARLKKFYLRSAATGIGKTRSMIADACNIACNKIYDESFGWIKNGTSEPTLFITTEQELEEIQTMMLAFLSNVNEEHIINGEYEGDEEERVIKAGEILESSPLYVEELPDFSLKDVENVIKKNIRDHDVKYIFHDYIHTSLKILEEITKRSGGVKLREDNILFMLSNKLKDICNQYGVFIMSATQLNGDYQEAKTPDQNLLRGAKSIADKIDYGSILLSVKEEDIDALDSILSSNIFEKPTIKMSVYKNRRGRYKGIIMWCKADLGTCRIQPMFCTTYDYELINMDDIKIIVEKGAWDDDDEE